MRRRCNSSVPLRSRVTQRRVFSGLDVFHGTDCPAGCSGGNEVVSQGGGAGTLRCPVQFRLMYVEGHSTLQDFVRAHCGSHRGSDIEWR